MRVLSSLPDWVVEIYQKAYTLTALGRGTQVLHVPLEEYNRFVRWVDDQDAEWGRGRRIRDRNVSEVMLTESVWLRPKGG